MTTEIPTPVIDNIASMLNEMMGGANWRAWPTVAVKDQQAAMIRDDLAGLGLSWADSRAIVIGMDKAFGLMAHFTGHPDGYRSLVMTVDLLKEKAAEVRPPAAPNTAEPTQN
jgi:hypothetical protein